MIVMTQYLQKWAPRPKPEELQSASGKIDDLLYNLLKYATPYKTEIRLLNYFPKSRKRDALGNIFIRVGKAEDSKTIFSCHMDTVHATAIVVDPMVSAEGMVYGVNAEDKTPSVLGADDKVGVYIMLRMIKQKIPGMYIFHVGEEMGGKGSDAIVELCKSKPELLHGAERIIAFDRANYGDVITHQRGGRCCSQDFALALAGQLNVSCPPKQQFSPCNGGTFTDTANYIDLIGECTNISIGYFSQHTVNEHFDHVWLTDHLLPAIFKVEWEKLPTVRKPGEREKPTVTYSRSNYQPWNKWGGHRNTNQQAVQKVLEFKQGNKDDFLKQKESSLKLELLVGVSFGTALEKIPKIDMTEQLPTLSKDYKLALKACIYRKLLDIGHYQMTEAVYNVLAQRDTQYRAYQLDKWELEETIKELEAKVDKLERRAAELELEMAYGNYGHGYC